MVNMTKEGITRTKEINNKDACIFAIGRSFGILSRLTEVSIESGITVNSINETILLAEQIVELIRGGYDVNTQNYAKSLKKVRLHLMESNMKFTHKKTNKLMNFKITIENTLMECINIIDSVSKL